MFCQITQDATAFTIVYFPAHCDGSPQKFKTGLKLSEKGTKCVCTRCLSFWICCFRGSGWLWLKPVVKQSIMVGWSLFPLDLPYSILPLNEHELLRSYQHLTLLWAKWSRTDDHMSMWIRKGVARGANQMEEVYFNWEGKSWLISPVKKQP